MLKNYTNRYFLLFACISIVGLFVACTKETDEPFDEASPGQEAHWVDKWERTDAYLSWGNRTVYLGADELIEEIALFEFGAERVDDQHWRLSDSSGKFHLFKVESIPFGKVNGLHSVVTSPQPGDTRLMPSSRCRIIHPAEVSGCKKQGAGSVIDSIAAYKSCQVWHCHTCGGALQWEESCRETYKKVGEAKVYADTVCSPAAYILSSPIFRWKCD